MTQQIFGYPIKNQYELKKDGGYSLVSTVERRNGKQYIVAASNYRYIGAAPGSEWEVITDAEDYSSTTASDLVETEEELFIPRYEYRRQELTFSSYEEMKSYWETNSVRVGDRNTGNGVEMVFALP